MAASLVTYRLKDGTIAEARVGVGGAEAAPRRIAEAEAALNGKQPGEVVFVAAADVAAAAVDPLDDAQIPPEYRRELVQAMVQRALQSAA
jgi:carbon-monoxide dehydrogenase medium subunit